MPLKLFADILDYPKFKFHETLRSCIAHPELTEDARLLLTEFSNFAEKLSLSKLEEVYSGTFDWGESLPLYIGYYLFGESYKRSVFLVGLKERYKLYNFSCENELPDHLAVMLRFLSIINDYELKSEIISHALLPALSEMIKKGDKLEKARPYKNILKALYSLLEEKIKVRVGSEGVN